MAFKYRKTKYENVYRWLESSTAKCFYCADQEGAPLAIELFLDTRRGIFHSCLDAFEIGNLATDRHVIELIRPDFQNKDEARDWFKAQAEKSGYRMVAADVINLGEDEGDSYSYHFVHDWPTYQCCMKELSGQAWTC
jgi:hypothetical protein